MQEDPKPSHDPDTQEVSQTLIDETKSNARFRRTWAITNKPVAEQRKLRIGRFREAVQERLDAFAVSGNSPFLNMTDACTYATSSIKAFRDDAQYCVTFRDQTWQTARKIIRDINDGTRAVPASLQTILNELPVGTWP